MAVVSDQTKGIDLYRGQVRCSIALADLAGPNGMELSVEATYSSDVLDVATHWNIERPTGVLGLGWRLPSDAIFTDYSKGVNDPQYQLRASKASGRLYYAGQNADGTLQFQCDNFSFWQVSYDQARRAWRVVRENGDVYVYGDGNTAPGAIEWGIAWQNWGGASSVAAGQAPVPLAFHLSSISNRFGDRIVFEYAPVVYTVGSSTSPVAPVYTQASYISRITGAKGDRLEFYYQDKVYDNSNREYQDGHTNPVPPNAYQDRLEKRYLDTLVVYAADGAKLYAQKFVYTDTHGQTVILGQGDLAKRVLLQVVRTERDNTVSLPPHKFDYFGLSQQDGVTADQPYNATTHAVYGALKTYTSPDGGSISYQYSSLTPTFSNRQVTLPPPVQSGVTFSQPLFYFADDYVAVTWFGSDNSMRVQAYWWDGQWLSPTQVSQLDTVPVSGSAAYAAVPVTASDRIFGIYSQNQVHLYAADPFRPGTWILPSVNSIAYFTTAFDPAEPVVLGSGDQFVAALGLQSGKLYRYHFNGSAWIADGLVTLQAGSATACFGIAATGNWLFTLATASRISQDALHIAAYHLDPALTWQAASFSQSRPQSRIDTLGMQAGSTYVVAQFKGAGAVSTVVSNAAYWWPADFSALQGQILAQFETAAPAPPFVSGSFVAMGRQLFRFNGAQWTAARAAGSGTLSAITYSADTVEQILQKEQQYSYSLARYNPNTGAWDEMLSSTASQGTNVNLAPSGPDVSAYVVLNNALYYQKPDATFAATGNTIPALSGDDARSPTLQADCYLAYQQNGAVTVWLLRNGVAQAAAPLTGQSLYTSAASLVGKRAFITYTGSWGGSGSVLTLYRVSGNEASGKIIVYPVSVVVENTGYQAISTAYAFDAPTALAARDGWSARYNMATVVNGSSDPLQKPFGSSVTCFFNGLAPGQTPTIPYPVDSKYTNAPNYYGFVTGLAYIQQAIASGAPTPASQQQSYWYVTTRTIGSAWVAAYPRLLKAANQVDGISSDCLATFNPDTGLVVRTNVAQWDSQGQQETWSTLYKYFWEIYDTSRALNLLTPVIETTSLTGNTKTVVFVATYRGDWGNGPAQWAPDRSYRARNASSPDFQNWQPNQPDPPGWLCTLRVNARTGGGQPLVIVNALGVPASLVYDQAGMLITASCFGADSTADELSYCGFEPYEDTSGWMWSDPSQPLQNFIKHDDYHTGEWSLLLPSAAVKTGPVRTFIPVDQTRKYVFGSWVKTAAGFNPAQGQAQWEIGVYATESSPRLGATLLVPFGNTNNQWTYVQQTIDLPAIRAAMQPAPMGPLQLRITGYNQNSATIAYVDDVRFSPLDARLETGVFDAHSRQATAALGSNGETSRVIYDPFNRVVASIGPGETVKALAAESLSRSQSGSDTFLPQFPNSVLGLSTGSASRYYDFRDASATQWIFNGTGGTWAIQGGTLQFTGTSSDPLGATAVLNELAFTNFAARVLCPSPTAIAGIGNGDIYAYWDESAALYKLARANTSGPPTQIHSSNAIGFRSDWVFAIIDGVVLFFAGGVQVFAYDYQNPAPGPNVGKATLLATATASFDDLIVLNNPQMSVTFRHGGGEVMQTVSLLGRAGVASYPTVAQGRFFDAIGRPYVTRNPEQPALAIDLPQGVGPTPRYLVEGGEATYLVTSTGQPLTKAQYLSGTFGFDYTERVYENSPLSRVKKVILPREAGQTASHFTVSYTYGQATQALIQDVLPAGTNPSFYAMDSTTDQNGTTTYRIYTSLGQLVAIRTALDGGAYHTRSFIWDAAGNLATTRQPNYYHPPANSSDTVWQETRTYTYNHLLASVTTPDRGAINYLYDDLDRLRFAQDANGAGATPPVFVYYKYDSLNRMTETGYIADANVTWTTLQGQVNTTSYPDLNSVQGRWHKRLSYDVTDTGDALNRIDRVWKVALNVNADANQPDQQTFTWDADGSVTQESSIVRAYSADAWVTNYTYDNLKNVIVLQYPAKNGETPFQVGYYYDRLGRLAAVGKPVDPGAIIDPSNPATGDEALYAAYFYYPNGGIEKEVLNNRKDGPYSFQRQYTFNQLGWLRSISDPYFSEQLDFYERTGYNNQAYYNGEIARSDYTFPLNGHLCPSAPYTYLYGYDRLGRLTAAQNSLNDAYTVMLQSYDANGNTATQSRGATTFAFSYRQSGQSQQVVNDHLYQVTRSVSNAIVFDNTPTVWRWAASNFGPSTTAIQPKQGGGFYLALAGGSLGHYEYLRLDTYLDPAGTYQLNYSVQTPVGYSGGTGADGWYLVLVATSGAQVEVCVATVPDTGEQWQTVSVPPISIPSLLRTVGPDTDVASVSLELRNYRRLKTGAGPGLAINVTSISVNTTASIAGQPFTYDSNGAVKSAPDRGITAVTYDSVTGLTSSIAASNTSTFTYNGRNLRSLEKYASVNRLYLRAAESNPLRMRTNASGTDQDTYLIYGGNGIVAFENPNGLFFPLRDHLGSTRVVVNSANQVTERRDYLPSGQMMRIGGAASTQYLYTGHELDSQRGLYNFGARFYDPAIGRFYSTDPMSVDSPYAYVNGNPISFTDPSGQSASWFDALWTTAGTVGGAGAFVASTWYSTKFLFRSIGTMPDTRWLSGAIKFGVAALVAQAISSQTLAYLLDRSDFVDTWYGAVWNSWTDLESETWKNAEKSGEVWKRVSDVLKNVSRQEVAVLIRYHPIWIMPFTFPWHLVSVYYWGIELEMPAYDHNPEFEENPRGANAVRHILWMCRLSRKWQLRGFAQAYGEAHEVARANSDPTDSLADTLNNALAMSYAQADSRNCTEIALSLWREGVLVQNAEGSNLNSLELKDQQTIAQSFRNAIQRLKELHVPLPKLPEKEFEEVRANYPTIAKAIDEAYGTR